MQIQATEIIRKKLDGLRLGILITEKVKVAPSGDLFEEELKKLQNELEDKFATRRPAENEVVHHVRRMYRRIGWEPTQYRPSSEALVRRLLKGKGLYRINNLVDFGNLTSARFHLPMGLYDSDKIVGTVYMDVGQPGEVYQGISKDRIHAEGKLILRDEQGIFGNPTADSRRTSITEQTRNAMAVFFCPAETDEVYITKALQFLEEYYQTFGARVKCRYFIIGL